MNEFLEQFKFKWQIYFVNNYKKPPAVIFYEEKCAI